MRRLGLERAFTNDKHFRRGWLLAAILTTLIVQEVKSRSGNEGYNVAILDTIEVQA